jgi:hypothetical protein
MIESKFPFRQFFDFRFDVNASRFFNLPTLSYLAIYRDPVVANNVSRSDSISGT